MEHVLVKAFVPRDLKRRAFGVLALQEESFSAWLREQLASFVEQAEPGGHWTQTSKGDKATSGQAG